MLGDSPNGSPERRVYAWEKDEGEEDVEIAALKAEIDEQVSLRDPFFTLPEKNQPQRNEWVRMLSQRSCRQMGMLLTLNVSTGEVARRSPPEDVRQRISSRDDDQGFEK